MCCLPPCFAGPSRLLPLCPRRIPALAAVCPPPGFRPLCLARLPLRARAGCPHACPPLSPSPLLLLLSLFPRCASLCSPSCFLPCSYSSLPPLLALLAPCGSPLSPACGLFFPPPLFPLVFPPFLPRFLFPAPLFLGLLPPFCPFSPRPPPLLPLLPPLSLCFSRFSLFPGPLALESPSLFFRPSGRLSAHVARPFPGPPFPFLGRAGP